MAKVAFGKLNLKQKEAEIKKVTINGVEVEVKTNIPIKEQRELVEEVVNQILVASDKKFINPIVVDIYTHLALIEYYSNITFTDKQKEDVEKLYSILSSNRVIAAIAKAIDTDELGAVLGYITRILTDLKEYDNSMYGIMDNISTEYSNAEFDVNNLLKNLNDPKNVGFLKEVLDKLG